MVKWQLSTEHERYMTLERKTVKQWTLEREFSQRVGTRAGDPDKYITMLIVISLRDNMYAPLYIPSYII